MCCVTLNKMITYQNLLHDEIPFYMLQSYFSNPTQLPYKIIRRVDSRFYHFRKKIFFCKEFAFFLYFSRLKFYNEKIVVK